MSTLYWHTFSNRSDCSLALAQTLEKQLQQSGLVLLPGGSSPKHLLANLTRECAIDWSAITVSATDERWVPAESTESNYALLRHALPKAQHLDPRQQQVDPELAASQWGQVITGLLPSRATLLGMGDDGHFASLFPAMPNLAKALQPQTTVSGLVARAPSEPKIRLSLNLSAYYQTAWLGLLIFGEAKKQLLEQAANAQNSLPISHFIQHSPQPIQVYWAP